MKTLRSRLLAAARETGVPPDVIEKDYALSYVLAGMSTHEQLSQILLLKGGTALKKLYFGEYRFSEDLDFTDAGSGRKGPLDEPMKQAVSAAGTLLLTHGPFDWTVERYEEREPHPRGQEAFVIRLRFPWHREALCRIKVEVTTDEPVVLEPQRRHLIHGYEEDLECTVACYALEEIIAEKLRTLLQTHRKLATRGWNRPRARDYYDLWRIVTEYEGTLKRSVVPDLLDRKASSRGVSWQSIDDFFTPELVAEATRTWDSSLSPFVANLPPFDTVVGELRIKLESTLR